MEGIRRMSGYLVNFASTTDKQGSFSPEESRKKGTRSTQAKLIAGAVCPLCGKGIQESPKAFGCSEWKNGCCFTLWKDALTRYGGPVLTEKLVVLLLQKRTLVGSTGTISLNGDYLTFTKKDDTAPCCSIAIRYVKNNH